MNLQEGRLKQLRKCYFGKNMSPIILLNQHEQWQLKDPKTVMKTSVPK